MVTDNHKVGMTIGLVAAVLLLTLVPLSQTIHPAFADKLDLFSGLSHSLSATVSSHTQNLWSGFGNSVTSSSENGNSNAGQGWDENSGSQPGHDYNWHHHGDGGSKH